MKLKEFLDFRILNNCGREVPYISTSNRGVNISISIKNEWTHLEDLEIVFYTGLKDKDGNKIYSKNAIAEGELYILRNKKKEQMTMAEMDKGILLEKVLNGE